MEKSSEYNEESRSQYLKNISSQNIFNLAWLKPDSRKYVLDRMLEAYCIECGDKLMANEEYEKEKATLVNLLMVQAKNQDEERKILERVRAVETEAGHKGNHTNALKKLSALKYEDIVNA